MSGIFKEQTGRSGVTGVDYEYKGRGTPIP